MPACLPSSWSAATPVAVCPRTNQFKCAFLYVKFGKQRIELSELKHKQTTQHDADSEDELDNGAELSFEYHCKITEYDNSLDSLRDYEKKDFHLSDICDFIKVGVQAIVDDEVTKRFDTEGN